MMLVVRGDSNDADFVTQLTPITQEQLDRYAPLIAAIKKFKKYTTTDTPANAKRHGTSVLSWTHDHNWPKGEYGYRPDLGEKSITELYGDLAEEFDEQFVPNGGESGGYSLHTIVEIFVVKLDQKLFTASNHYKGWALV